MLNLTAPSKLLTTSAPIPELNLIPSADTTMIAATITLRLFEKSTCASTTFRTPIAAIIPYNMNEIPPTIPAGITSIIIANLGENDSNTAI